jgi:aryl-alcohol dehydrogenase-like predicted oxidoreductase
MIELPIILGGHTYIQQLGNEPCPSSAQIDEIVSKCLDAGICWFDTTYRPERIALGESLQRLGRRAEAHILVWNFFKLFEPGEEVGGPNAYQSHHLQEILRDLRSDYIDALVIHAVSQPGENERQTHLAVTWQDQGLIGQLGLWSPGVQATRQVCQTGKPYHFVVEPHNVTTIQSPGKLESYAQAGWEVYACSPFVRGWELDRLVEKAAQLDGLSRTKKRSQVSDLLIRFSLFSPHVNRLIIAMRRPEWVESAVTAVRRGPLSMEEQVFLNSLITS